MTDIQPSPDPRVLTGPARWLLQALAAFCLFMAVVGIVLPVMPTVPFLIAAAWAAARSSPRLHRWLLAHPRFGRTLADWHEAGVVSRRAKWFSTVMMAASAASMPVFLPAGWALVGVPVVVGMGVVLVWLWRRPEERRG